MSVADSAELIVGVDTHLDAHTAAICDARGRAMAQLRVPATQAGYRELLAWADAVAAGGLGGGGHAALRAGPFPVPGRRGPAGRGD